MLRRCMCQVVLVGRGGFCRGMMVELISILFTKKVACYCEYLFPAVDHSM